MTTDPATASSSDAQPADDPLETVRVELAERGYEIRVGAGALRELGPQIAALSRQKRDVVIADETVARHHLGRAEDSLRAAGLEPVPVLVPPGETTKSFDYLETLLDRLLAEKVERSHLIVALGGGVVGDLVGFAASVLRRGIGFVQVPTTLLAQVDSSVGGKTAINTPFGKNLIGAFHQPRLVLADTTTLDTLSPRDLRAGYAEVVKYGLIDDPDFFDWLDTTGHRLLSGDEQARQHAVARCCRAKARIVAADERETGERALLNLGHTFGHALEAATGMSDRLLHGEGVAIGMVLAHEFSARLGLAPAEDAERVRAHLRKTGLAHTITGIPGPALSAEELLHHMWQDKKVAEGRLTFILTRGIGQAFIARDVDPADVSAFLTERVSAPPS